MKDLEQVKKQISEAKFELEEKLNTLEFIEDMINDLPYYMVTKTDEDGTPLLDEDGNEIKEIPTRENATSWAVNSYNKRVNVIEIVTKDLFKK